MKRYPPEGLDGIRVDLIVSVRSCIKDATRKTEHKHTASTRRGMVAVRSCVISSYRKRYLLSCLRNGSVIDRGIIDKARTCCVQKLRDADTEAAASEASLGCKDWPLYQYVNTTAAPTSFPTGVTRLRWFSCPFEKVSSGKGFPNPPHGRALSWVRPYRKPISPGNSHLAPMLKAVGVTK